ncbi:MAG TPA: hypothetical protein V6C46_10585, partial [Coleofasciculaceae cyanobacterium]
MTITIQGALVAGDLGYQTMDIQIQGGEIAAIQLSATDRSTAPQLEPDETLVDGRNKLLLPGFVNAHTHSSELWQRGLIPPMPLELWIAELYDFVPLDPEQVY